MKIDKKRSLRILDCTLRDGGYYNNWDYDKIIYDSYVSAINKSNIKYVEVGFRFDVKEKFLGPFAFTSDDNESDSLILVDTNGDVTSTGISALVSIGEVSVSN